MKIKGPSIKAQQKQTVAQQQTTQSIQNKQIAKQQLNLHNVQNSNAKEISVYKENSQDNRSRTQVRQQLMHQKSKPHKKQLIKQSSSQQAYQEFNQTQPQQKTQLTKSIQINQSAKHELQTRHQKKSRSQADLIEDQIEGNQDKYIKQDRSVIVENSQKQEDINEIEFRKRKNAENIKQRSNPFLNQIKKTTAVLKNKEPLEEYKEKYLLNASKQNASKQIQNASKQVPKASKSCQQKQKIIQQMQRLHTRFLQPLWQTRGLKEQSVSISSSISNLKSNLSAITGQQNASIQRQEYQEADRLEQEIQKIMERVRQQEGEIRRVQQEICRLGHQGIDIQETRIEQQKRLIRRLRLLELDIENQMACFERRQEERIQKEKTKNQNQNRKIARIIGDIKSQQQQMQKYQRTFQEDVEARIGPLKQVLSQELDKKQQLQQQIKGIQDLLRKKKVQLKTTLSTIASTQSKIQQADHAFQQQRSKLVRRKQNLSQLQQQKSLLTSKLVQMQESTTLLQTCKTQQLQSLLTRKQSISTLAQALQTRLSSINPSSYIQAKRQLLRTFIQKQKALIQFQAGHRQQKQQVKEMEFRKCNILSEIGRKQQTLKQLKTIIPRLENQQRQLSLAKNFKGAGMKKTEIRECNDQIVEIKKHMEELYLEESELEGRVQEIKLDQERFIDEEISIRRELAIGRWEFVTDKKEELLRELEWLNSEQNVQIKQKYRKMLSQQLRELTQQIKSIGEQYNLSPGQSDFPVNEPHQFIPRESYPTNAKEATIIPTAITHSSYNQQSQLPQHTKITISHSEENSSLQSPNPQDIFQLPVADQQASEQDLSDEEQQNMGQNDHEQNQEPDDQTGYVPLQLD